MAAETHEFESFNKSRNNEDSLEKIEREMKEKSIREDTRTSLDELKTNITTEVIQKLEDWMKVVKWDELHHINHITTKDFHITWYDWTIKWKWDEANHIWPLDTIQIKWGKVYRSHNWKETEIWEIDKGKDLVVAAKAPKKDKSEITPPTWWNNPPVTSAAEKKPNIPENTPSTPENIPPVIPETQKVKKWKTIGYSKNWENYIIWKKWEPELVTMQELTPEFKKSLEQYKETLILVENMNLLLSALENTTLTKQYIQESINSFNPLKAKESNNNIQQTIKEYFNWLDIDNKEDINLKDRLSVLSYIRDELGNYELVRKNIIEKNFNSLTKISEEELQQFIENPSNNQKNIKKILWEEDFLTFQENIIDKKAEAEKYFINYQEQLKKQYPWINTEQLKKIIINSFVWTYSKIKLSESYIDKNKSTYMNWYNWKNKELDLFSDIQWIWALSLSDENSNIGWEWFKLVATELAALAAWLVTWWAWAFIVNAAVYWWRTYKWLKYLYEIWKLADSTYKWANIIQKWKIISANIGRIAAMSIIEWWAFYLWYWRMQSTIEWKNMYSLEWLWESIMYMWAFKSLNVLYKVLWKEIQAWIPLSKQKLRIWTQFIAEWTTLAWIWLWTQWILFEPWEWTAETILQAYLMAAWFKAIWIKMNWIKFKQNKWEVKAEIIEEKSSKTETNWPKETTEAQDVDNLLSWLKREMWESTSKTEKGWVKKAQENKTWKKETSKKIESKENTTIKLPKNEEFIIKDWEKICTIKTGENWEIINVKIKYIKYSSWRIKKENFNEVLKIMQKKEIEFWKDWNWNLIYRMDWKIFNKNWNPSQARKFIQEEKPQEKVQTTETISNEEYKKRSSETPKQPAKKAEAKEETIPQKAKEKPNPKEGEQTIPKKEKETPQRKPSTFNKAITKKINKLEDWWTFKIWEYIITKKWDGIFELEKWSETTSYSNLQILLKNIKVSRNDKIQTILKLENKQQLDNANEILRGIRIEVRKNNDWYSFFSEWKEIKNMSNSQANRILEALFPGAKIENLKNIFPDQKFDKMVNSISNKLNWKAKEAFDKSIALTKKSYSSGTDLAKNILYKWLWWDSPFLAFKDWKFWKIAVGLWTIYSSQNEILWIVNSFIDDKKWILTEDNAMKLWVIVWNWLILWKLWIVRTFILDKTFDSFLPKEYQDIIL